MRANERLRLNDAEHTKHAGMQTVENTPQKPVKWDQPRPSGLASTENRELWWRSAAFSAASMLPVRNTAH